VAAVTDATIGFLLGLVIGVPLGMVILIIGLIFEERR